MQGQAWIHETSSAKGLKSSDVTMIFNTHVKLLFHYYGSKLEIFLNA